MSAPFKRGDIVLYLGKQYGIVVGPGPTYYAAERGVGINWIGCKGETYRELHPEFDFNADPRNLEKVTEMSDD